MTLPRAKEPFRFFSRLSLTAATGVQAADLREGPNAGGKNAEVPGGQWSMLRVIARGSLFEVFLNGRKLFELNDATFRGAGRIGLWTKADSVTLFDDLLAVNLDCPNAPRGEQK